MINNILNNYTLGVGGIGDFLLTLACSYDKVDEMNLVFFANNRNQIKELVKLFPKIKKSLILEKDYKTIHEFYFSEKCINTGILPKNMDYRTWNNVNIFRDYGVIEHPKFIRELFKEKRVFEKQIFIQKNGSNQDGAGKKRILLDETIKKIYKEFYDYEFIFLESLENASYKDIFELILGSDLVIGVDSFCKTFSALAGIKTIVYNSIYSQDYLKNFNNKIDYGNYVFLNNWKMIEQRSQL